MKTRSVLIAEDDSSLVTILSRIFEDKEFFVHAADNGESAIEKFFIYRPDIVLMDIDMPEKNGWEVLEEIRGVDKQTQVIIMTGQNLEKNASTKSYELGATVFLRKPFCHDEIVEMIDSFVKTKYRDMDIISLSNYQLNMTSYKLKVNSTMYFLTEREAKVLYMLSQNVNEVVETEEILRVVWSNAGAASNDQMLKNLITRLRKMLAENDTINLNSVYGRGYLLSCFEEKNGK